MSILPLRGLKKRRTRVLTGLGRALVLVLGLLLFGAAVLWGVARP